MLRIKTSSSSYALLLQLLSKECHRTALVIGQLWLRCLMAQCHYLSQCWPRSILPYGITRPWWVNLPLTRDLLCGHMASLPPTQETCTEEYPANRRHGQNTENTAFKKESFQLRNISLLPLNLYLNFTFYLVWNLPNEPREILAFHRLIRQVPLYFMKNDVICDFVTTSMG